MSAARPLLEADGLGKSFGAKQVLTAASFGAWPGRVTALMGRNGSGKTTMLRLAVGRVPSDWGRVIYEGEFLRRPRLHRMAARGLMYCAQESAVTPRFSVEDHFRAYVQVYGGEASLPGVVERLRLGELLRRRPNDVSGGERQRVSLGLALLRSPRCLLSDEPFAGVAPKDRPMVADALRELRGRGTAVVVTGHDVEDLLAVADEVIWVVGGTTHWLGSPEEACRHHQFRRGYLGPRGVGAHLGGGVEGGER